MLSMHAAPSWKYAGSCEKGIWRPTLARIGSNRNTKRACKKHGKALVGHNKMRRHVSHIEDSKHVSHQEYIHGKKQALLDLHTASSEHSHPVAAKHYLEARSKGVDHKNVQLPARKSFGSMFKNPFLHKAGKQSASCLILRGSGMQAAKDRLDRRIVLLNLQMGASRNPRRRCAP